MNYKELLPKISKDCGVELGQATVVVELLKNSNTIPFIARYRKEATKNLDEVKIRQIQERLQYLSDLESRRETVVKSIESQGKLDEELRKKILQCQDKTSLEDLYLPFKPKRRTRGMIAKEKGLEPLALKIIAQDSAEDPKELAKKFIDQEKNVSSEDEALAGARDIVAEIISEKADFRTFVRKVFGKQGQIKSLKKKDIAAPTKFEQYYEHSEPLAKIPSHRFLAISRGEKENVLRMSIDVPEENSLEFANNLMGLKQNDKFADQLALAIKDCYKRLVAPSIEIDLRVELKMKSDREAIEIFAQNLRKILLAAPLGGQCVLGIDPGLRTGCKLAVVDNTGKFLENATIFLLEKNNKEKAANILLGLIEKHKPKAIAIGNGTAGRETESFVKNLLKEKNIKDVVVVSVSESGASVYSASEIAREEFPDLDLTVRGAISIARRLQDPLSELVKVEPKSLGVGQYQHDVYQPLLEKKLNEVVESCVNKVGVDLNTASAPLLSFVAGIGPKVAKKIVEHREQNGAFKNRFELKKVSGLGEKTFEQAAGFLRIKGDNPLDASAVHPERYSVVEKIARDLQVDIGQLVGNKDLAKNIDADRYVTDSLGLLTLKDIVNELQKPGRDPRENFQAPSFRDDVSSISDLMPGMILEGIVTNVAAFGAFVDVGVHQDGLVHVSELSHQFIKDPSSVVSTGDKIKVLVKAVDVERKRITLSAKLENDAVKKNKRSEKSRRNQSSSRATLASVFNFKNLKN